MQKTMQKIGLWFSALGLCVTLSLPVYNDCIGKTRSMALAIIAPKEAALFSDLSRYWNNVKGRPWPSTS